MTKREKVIVSVMGATVLFGAYTLLLSPDEKKSETIKASPASTFEMMTKNYGKKIFTNAKTPSDQYIIQLAEKAWNKDPFIPSDTLLIRTKAPKPTPKSLTSAQSQVVKNLLYSGYIASSDKKIAIINGLEYEEGQSIKGTGYYIKRIFKYRIRIKSIDGSHEATISWNKKGP